MDNNWMEMLHGNYTAEADNMFHKMVNEIQEKHKSFFSDKPSWNPELEHQELNEYFLLKTSGHDIIISFSESKELPENIQQELMAAFRQCYA
jgi:hypothetical protein